MTLTIVIKHYRVSRLRRQLAEVGPGANTEQIQVEMHAHIQRIHN